MLVAAATALGAPPPGPPSLETVLRTTKAIDNHAHPKKYVPEGGTPDDEFDALPCDTLEQAPGPMRTRLDNPEWVGVWHALYGYGFHDMTPEHVKEMVALKERAMREHAEGYPAWMLDQMGIETMFANRVAMGAGLAPPRFRWVPFADALMLPLNNESAKRLNSDFDWFYSHEEKLLKSYLTQAHLHAPPAALGEYLKQVVTPTLERQKREGAVALKFEAAYLRPLNFGRVSEAEAERIYARYIRGGEAPEREYRALQDFLFHAIAQEAGRLGLAVHFHTGPGCGDYFVERGANPSLLEGVFNDPSLRKTNFVIVHGGWGTYPKQVAALLQKPNVYADFSFAVQALYPAALAGMLREWLELYPEKVLFGTDASPGPPQMSWEEGGWIAAGSARKALEIALDGMIRDGEISPERANEIAVMVLRGNAIKLYGLKP